MRKHNEGADKWRKRSHCDLRCRRGFLVFGEILSEGDMARVAGISISTAGRLLKTAGAQGVLAYQPGSVQWRARKLKLRTK